MASREEIARIELGHTDVTPALARVLTLAFLALLLGVVVVQAALDGGAPYAFRVTELAPPSGGLPTEASIERFEDEVERSSFLRERLRPTAQAWLVRAGLGNEEVVLGRDGWLFYAPDVAYVTGEGFLAPRRLARLEHEHRFGGRQPDPLRALVDFRDALAERGIELVVLPVPVKPQVAHERLVPGSGDPGARLANPSERAFFDHLADAGVRAVDVGAVLRETNKGDAPSYLATDTHWTPEAMAFVARATASELLSAGLVTPGTSGRYRETRADVVATGDVATMLGLPAGETRYAQERVTVRPVVETGSRAAWTPEPGASVLLLGDSFTNVFALGEMGFGEAAGLAEHLSLALGQPVDRIARNAGGAHAAREGFVDALRRDPERFAATRVVVYQFAMRELAQGDWKLLALPEQSAATGERRPAAGTSGTLTVRATIADISRPPDPSSVPYKDALIALHLVDVQGAKGPIDVGAELIAFAFGMRDRAWTPAAELDPGASVVLELVPWEDVEPRLGGLNRVELDDPDFQWIDLPLYWVDAVAR